MTRPGPEPHSDPTINGDGTWAAWEESTGICQADLDVVRQARGPAMILPGAERGRRRGRRPTPRRSSAAKKKAARRSARASRRRAAARVRARSGQSTAVEASPRRPRARARDAPGAGVRGTAGRPLPRRRRCRSAARPAGASGPARCAVAGQAAGVRGEPHDVRGDARWPQASRSWAASPERLTVTATSVGARSSLAAEPGLASSAIAFAARARRARAAGSATGSSGGGSAPSARARRAPATVSASTGSGPSALWRAARVERRLDVHGRASQQARMRAASTAAFFALSSPTHATGTPGGIWAIERIASSPPAADRRLVSGTPITGRSVCGGDDARQRGRQAGAGDDHPDPAHVRVLRRSRRPCRAGGGPTSRGPRA